MHFHAAQGRLPRFPAEIDPQITARRLAVQLRQRRAVIAVACRIGIGVFVTPATALATLAQRQTDAGPGQRCGQKLRLHFLRAEAFDPYQFLGKEIGRQMAVAPEGDARWTVSHPLRQVQSGVLRGGRFGHQEFQQFVQRRRFQHRIVRGGTRCCRAFGFRTCRTLQFGGLTVGTDIQRLGQGRRYLNQAENKEAQRPLQVFHGVLPVVIASTRRALIMRRPVGVKCVPSSARTASLPFCGSSICLRKGSSRLPNRSSVDR